MTDQPATPGDPGATPGDPGATPGDGGARPLDAATAPPDRARAARPDAVVAVLVRAGRVLVIRRGPEVVNPGYWTLPSGRVEPGEAQPETLVREVREELGLAVTPVAKVWECDTHDGAFRLHWWTARLGDGELRPDPGEVAEARWVRPGEFGRLSPTFPGDHEFFDLVLPTLPAPDHR
jgi:8-oxo-dGTP pyrophosphatase MutT (NUDIX family)